MAKRIVCICILVLFSFGLLNINFKKGYYIENILPKNLIGACFIFNEDYFIENSMHQYSYKAVSSNGKVFLYVKTEDILDFLKTNYEYVEFSFYGEMSSFFKNKLNLKILNEEKIENKHIFYCYCCNLNKHIYLNGLKINFQIVEENGFVKVGYPIVYTSY